MEVKVIRLMYVVTVKGQAEVETTETELKLAIAKKVKGNPEKYFHDNLSFIVPSLNNKYFKIALYFTEKINEAIIVEDIIRPALQCNEFSYNPKYDTISSQNLREL